jgi:hypothetical protein
MAQREIVVINNAGEDLIRGVPIFQLLQWKYAIKLESKGLKHSRGSVTAHAKRVLGISGKREKVLAYIETLIADYNDTLAEQKLDANQ